MPARYVIKAGNAVILRGGSESFHSSGAIHACLQKGLRDANMPEDAIQRVPTRDREAVAEMLRMTDHIDVIVPRGGKGLVGLVQREARVPVFAHLEGICHVYVDKAADPEKARRVVLNAKTRRTGICGSAECLLVHRDVAATLGQQIVDDLMKPVSRCGLVKASWAQRPPSREDLGKEFLDMIIAAKVVEDVDEAIATYRVRLEPHRRRSDRRRCRGRTVLSAARQRDPDAQRLDAVCRWRRVRHGRRDRHRHGQDACARAGRRGAADQFQVSGRWRRNGTAISASGWRVRNSR